MRIGKLSAVIVTSLAALAACSEPDPTIVAAGAQAGAPPPSSLAGGNKRVTVMTRNLYLGADLPHLATVPPGDFFQAVKDAWDMVQKNDFRRRAIALADEIAEARPALVGLQEVYTWRTQSPADGPATRATDVRFDYLSILLDELAARGLAYRPVASVQLLDIEVPTAAPTATGFPAGTLDVRATDHGVILASDLVAQTRIVAERVFEAKIPFATPAGVVAVPRGFVAVDAKIRGEWIRFVSTHLEAVNVPADQLPPGVPPAIFRIQQAQELAGFLGADARPTLLVGDLNSDPGTEGAAILAAAGFHDLWATLHAGENGFTDGFPEDLSQDQPLTRRIDYVLSRGLFTPLAVDIVGATAADKALVGLWPSDHAGVVGTFRILDERFAASPSP